MASLNAPLHLSNNCEKGFDDVILTGRQLPFSSKCLPAKPCRYYTGNICPKLMFNWCNQHSFRWGASNLLRNLGERIDLLHFAACVFFTSKKVMEKKSRSGLFSVQFHSADILPGRRFFFISSLISLNSKYWTCDLANTHRKKNHINIQSSSTNSRKWKSNEKSVAYWCQSNAIN